MKVQKLYVCNSFFLKIHHPYTSQGFLLLKRVNYSKKFEKLIAFSRKKPFNNISVRNNNGTKTLDDEMFGEIINKFIRNHFCEI